MRIIYKLIRFIIILAGVFCAISLYQQITKTSYVNGNIDIVNEFRTEKFFYSSSAVAFYPGSNGGYYFEEELPPVENIDFSEKDYNFYFMDKPILTADMDGGLINTVIQIKFFNVDGTLACDAYMKLRVEFLSSMTIINLSTYNKSSADYFEQHFNDYGLKLELIENNGG